MEKNMKNLNLNQTINSITVKTKKHTVQYEMRNRLFKTLYKCEKTK